MRTLTSIQSSDLVKAELSIDITATDQSTTWTFGGNDLIHVGPISWEIPFGGGLGKTSTYDLTLGSSLGWIKTHLPQLTKAQTNLKVVVNSDVFYPHVGRVRQVRRNGQNPDLLQLTIFDRFLDTVPRFPSSLQDSYSVLHPQTLNADIGYPVYYGLHTRPFFHTPVDCDLKNLLGPRGVSSSNHVNSVWFSNNVLRDLDTSQKYFFPYKASWPQESGSSNIITTSVSFNIGDIGYEDVRLWSFTGTTMPGCDYPATIPQANLNDVNEGRSSSNSICFPNLLGGNWGTVNNKVSPVFPLKTINQISFQSSHDINNPVDSIHVSGANVSVFSSNNVLVSVFNTSNFTMDITSFGYSTTQDVSLSAFNGIHQNVSFGDTKLISVTSVGGTQISWLSTYINGSPFSSQYKNYSVLSTQINCSDIAVSKNPMFIISHIFSEYTTTPFVLSQNSQSQYDTSSYHFQCGFYERKPLDVIMNEFGEISKTSMFIGDSGQVNFRTYQDSTTLTNSSKIDFTITTSDMLSFNIRENPLGTSQFNSEKASRIRVDYDYDFPRKEYFNFLQADKTNTDLCNSADASGIETEIKKQTQYILESDTASYYLGNVVLFNTQAEEVLDISLPAKFFQLEVSDVVKVQNPIIQGSESLYQITKINADFMSGTVRATAQEILNRV